MPGNTCQHIEQSLKSREFLDMLQIPLEKVRFIAELAREVDAKVEAWDYAGETDDATKVLADLPGDAASIELATFIDDLNDDEQAELVALVWIGRGTFEADELPVAIQTARDEKVNRTSQYLMGIPLLSDYITEGIAKLGLSLDEA